MALPEKPTKKPLEKAPGKSTSAEIEAFLKTVAETPAAPLTKGRGRLIFAMDATASREPTWGRACHIQEEMFSETAALGGLEIQLVYFRGFDDFAATPWLDSSKDLVRRMTEVFCLGGHTQIERVLRHTLAEAKSPSGGERCVDALVFVGDCCEEDADALCHLAGELGLLGMPAFLFHEGNEPYAARVFKQIARLTGGAYCRFDSGSARELRELLAAVAVYAAGGRTALLEYGRRTGGAAGQIAGQLRLTGLARK